MMMKSHKESDGAIHHSRWTDRFERSRNVLHLCPRCTSCSASCSSTSALGLLHDLAELDSTAISHCGDEGVDERVRALVEEDSNSGLYEQVHGLEGEVPVERRAFQERRGELEGEREDRHHHRDYLHQWDLDDYVEDRVIARVGNWDWNGSRSVESMVNEVEEELAVEESPECRPDQVDGGRDGDVTSPIVPDELAHCD